MSFYGDLIAERTGLGKAWIGLILMASVTSLPELIVGISSSAIVQSADLAVGDIFGSCCFNLAILALLDIFVPVRKCLFSIASSNHVLSATLGIILIAFAGLALFLPEEIVIIPGIGVSSFVFFGIYLFSIRLIYRFEKEGKSLENIEHQTKARERSLKKIILLYSVFALIIIIAALFIPHFANQIADETGLGKTFVGTLLVAASTSLPEIAVSIAAVRMGSINLAVGNLLGSNIFNIFILAIDDVFYTKGVLLKDASDINLVSVFSAIVMASITIAGFTFRTETKRFRIAPDSFVILCFYVFSIILLYYLN